MSTSVDLHKVLFESGLVEVHSALAVIILEEDPDVFVQSNVEFLQDIAELFKRHFPSA